MAGRGGFFFLSFFKLVRGRTGGGGQGLGESLFFCLSWWVGAGSCIGDKGQPARGNLFFNLCGAES